MFLTAVRKDHYILAGQAIPVNMVHGGPSPGFLSNTLLDCLTKGSANTAQKIEDISDMDLQQKTHPDPPWRYHRLWNISKMGLDQSPLGQQDGSGTDLGSGSNLDPFIKQPNRPRSDLDLFMANSIHYSKWLIWLKLAIEIFKI